MELIKNNHLDGEVFGKDGRTYFVDWKLARNNTHYLVLTRSDKIGNNQYQRIRLIIFEEEIPFLIESMSMIFAKLRHKESGL